MTSPCEKHKESPVIGYSACPGCEVERLRAEVAGLRTGYEAYEQVNAELKAEVELLESSRAKLAGELSRLRAKHKDWSVIAALGQGEQS